jgi:hypothetical protein
MFKIQETEGGLATEESYSRSCVAIEKVAVDRSGGGKSEAFAFFFI